jgi:hypothetical protein
LLVSIEINLDIILIDTYIVCFCRFLSSYIFIC